MQLPRNTPLLSFVFIAVTLASSQTVTSGRVPSPAVTQNRPVRFEYKNDSFAIRVTGAGSVEFDGIKDVIVRGLHKRRITAEEAKKLLEAFREERFFSLNNDYSVAASDLGTETTVLQIGDRRKTVTDNFLQKPKALEKVQSDLLRYSHSAEWTIGSSETVSGLIAETASVPAMKHVLSKTLPAAAHYGDMTVVGDLLSYRIDPNRTGPFNDTALMLAAARGLPEMVEALLKAGADPGWKDEYGRDAMLFGAGSGSPKVVRLLLAAGLSGASADKYGDTALMAAAAAGNPQSVELLLRHGAQVNATNGRRQTALLSGATGDPGFSFEEAGRYRPDIPPSQVRRGEVMALLLGAGARINARGWFGETALFSLQANAVRALILGHANLEARDQWGRTPLIETASGEIAGILIKAGANVNARDEEGKTALIWAAENNQADKLEALVKAKGIRIEMRDDQGKTALMRARASHFPASVALLIGAGAVQ